MTTTYQPPEDGKPAEDPDAAPLEDPPRREDKEETETTTERTTERTTETTTEDAPDSEGGEADTEGMGRTDKDDE